MGATKTARATAASARSGGYAKSSIGAKARAAASSLAQHLSPEQFGRHAAPTSYGSARKNATGGNGYLGQHRSSGRHASENESGGGNSGRHINWFSSK